MSREKRIRLAVQKSGRLSDKTFALLGRCGLDLQWSKDRLFSRCENFPLDLLLLRDDDIPEYVFDGVCELGFVGENVLIEKRLNRSPAKPNDAKILRKLNYGKCRLALALPAEENYSGPQWLNAKTIATSYPAVVRKFLNDNGANAEVVELSGSVEIATSLNVADAICDLVSTGKTLISNGLREVQTVLESECVLVQTGADLSAAQADAVGRLLQRIDGVMKAEQAKYIMMNAPTSALPKLREILPGMEAPTVIPMGEDGARVAVHAVAYEPVFWETMEKLKAAGASSILVVPIEKIIA